MIIPNKFRKLLNLFKRGKKVKKSYKKEGFFLKSQNINNNVENRLFKED